MSQRNPQPPKKITLGRTGHSSHGTTAPMVGGKGRINTNWKDINWTPKKRITVISVLAFPYTVAVIACFSAGINLIGYILLGLAALFAMVILALYFIDQSDF